MFLNELGRHENIIHLLNVLKADNNIDIYLIFEYMETDLHVVIRSNILEPIHKQFVMYQCLKALKYMHSADLLHRDMKVRPTLHISIITDNFGISFTFSAK